MMPELNRAQLTRHAFVLVRTDEKMIFTGVECVECV